MAVAPLSQPAYGTNFLSIIFPVSAWWGSWRKSLQERESLFYLCPPPQPLAIHSEDAGLIRGTWVAQSVAPLTLAQGHYLVACELQPQDGLAAVGEEPTSDPLFPLSLGPSPTHALSLSQKKKKY